MALRDTIRESTDISTKEVHIPEWDVTLFVKGLTALERVQCSDDSDDDSDEPGVQNLSFMARMIVASVVDKDGNKVFQPDDADWFRTKSYAAFNRLFAAVAEVNGGSAASAEAARKNSEPTPPAASP